MKFMNLAHRGASAYAPENTLAAFCKAIELDASGIETDLQKSSDGVVFLYHDDKLDGKTDRKGYPADYTWEELKQFDAGTWFSPKYRGERLITFDEFLRFFGGKEIILAIELKAHFTEEEVKGVMKLVDRYQVREKVTMTSFIFENLATTRRVDPTIKIGYLLNEKITLDTIGQLKSIGGQQICPNAKELTSQDVLLAKDNGLEVRAWGVGNEELMQHALSCGVDGMTVNFPDKLNEALKSRP
ncbi:MAG: glycerophosphodiester phosphodiesterase family protein [Chloroflexota bacterium]